MNKLTIDQINCPHCSTSIDLIPILGDRAFSNLQQEIQANWKAQIENEIQENYSETLRIKLAEKDKLIQDLEKKFSEGQRKASQGSQKTQGQAAEIDLLTVLESSFPYDAFTPLNTYGDILHQVYTQKGNFCGTILWESKHTMHWRSSWIPKAKKDAQTQNAQLVIIATTALPQNIKSFDESNGVWITSRNHVKGIAAIFRAMLIKIAKTKYISQLNNGKSIPIISYISSTKFKNNLERVLNLVEERQSILQKRKDRLMREWTQEANAYEEMLNLIIEINLDIENLLENQQALPTRSRANAKAALTGK